MLPKVFSGLMLLLLIAAEVYPQINEFIITPQPAPAVIPVFTSHPDKAAIIIYSAIEGIQYESNTEGIFKELTDDASGTVTLIVYPEQQFIKVKKRGFLEGLIKISQLEQRQVLYYKIEPKTETANLFNVAIISDPPGADIYINDEFRGTGTAYELPAGEHKLRAVKAGYGENEMTINVSEKDIYFNIKLQKVNLVLLTVTSTPKESMVLINEVTEGNTDLQVFKMPGTYKIKVIKSGYLPQEEEITISPNTPLIKNFNLIENTGILNIIVNPEDSHIKLNNKEITQLSNIKLAPGTYKITAERRGYFMKEELILVGLKSKIDKMIILEGKTGSLQLDIKPIDAIGKLNYEGKRVKTFSGSQKFFDLIEGEYELELNATGYKSFKKILNIKFNETTNLAAQLTPGSDTPKDFVFVKGGSFEMGDKELAWTHPVHNVTLSDFYIAKYEVTQGLWKSVMGNNPSYFTGDNNLPVENVSWYDAIEFCNKLSEKEGLQQVYNGTGDNITMNINANGYRLPTEAEWEYAARGGNNSQGSQITGKKSLSEIAWLSENSEVKTHPVGRKKPNEFEIYDMIGNVGEWCWDWFGEYSSSPMWNPTGISFGSRRVIRSISFPYFMEYVTLAERQMGFPDSKSYDLGVRLVRSKL